MDSFIYALVLSPALTELLPKSGMANTHENVGLVGSVLLRCLATSFGRFVGAGGVNFLIGAMVRHVGTIGKPVAYTAIAFGLGLLIIPFAQETRNEPLPD